MSDDFESMKPIIAALADGRPLDVARARKAFDLIMDGAATPAQIGGFLMAMRVRGEAVAEITGGALALRERALTIEAPEGAIDTCGTGGDAKGSFNISTAAALVAAAAGVPVAKHGNRALSSKSGSADLLAALGVNIDAEADVVAEAIRKVGIGFMMAPRHHAAMKHVAAPRKELGVRTLFNLLGPLANPAGAKRQLLGVFAESWVEPIARVLANLGSEHAWVVHGSDGLDELTTTGPSTVTELKHGTMKFLEVHPEDAGLPVARPEDLTGGDAAYNASLMTTLLDGAGGPIRDIVLFNAAAALIVGDKADDLREGVGLAAEAVDSGKAKETLARLVATTNGGAP
jgi:anthranilate phosphoribosyltransferase